MRIDVILCVVFCLIPLNRYTGRDWEMYNIAVNRGMGVGVCHNKLLTVFLFVVFQNLGRQM